jgi:hypothetical protein
VLPEPTPPLQLLLLTGQACQLLLQATATLKRCAPGVCAPRCGLLLLPWLLLPVRRLLWPELLLLPLLALPMQRVTASNPPVVVQLLLRQDPALMPGMDAAKRAVAMLTLSIAS